MSLANRKIPIDNIRCIFCEYYPNCTFKYYKGRKIVWNRGGMLDPLIYRCIKGQQYEERKRLKQAKKRERERARWRSV